MTAVQLPAHLANRQVRSLTERAAEGMGATLPPHVSLAGNSFTFIDAAGNEYKPVLTFDAVIIDISDRMNKRYYDKPYNPKEVGEAPRCWSANGITPSREVAAPISPDCESCKLNVRGSAVSQISGSSIKACRDEKWIAFISPQMPTVVFQLVITPGSFKNWKAYTEQFRNYGIELSFAITRFSFVPGSTGELLFENVGWVDEATVVVVEAAVREGKTDALVGRSDPVRQPALAAAPVAQAQLTHTTVLPPNQMPVQEVIPPQQSFVPAAAASVAPTASPQAPFPSATPSTAPAQGQPFPAGGATTASPTEQPAPRRRRRTSAEIAAAGAPAPQAMQPTPMAQQPFAPAAAPQPAFQPTAPQPPFPVAAAAAPASAAAQFGMAPGAPVNAEMADMLAKMGFQRVPA